MVYEFYVPWKFVCNYYVIEFDKPTELLQSTKVHFIVTATFMPYPTHAQCFFAGLIIIDLLVLNLYSHYWDNGAKGGTN